MGFLGDLWDFATDVVTAPFELAWDVASAPVEVIVDAARGENILKSVGDQFKEIVGETINVASGWQGAAAKTELGQKVLTENFKVGSIELGLDKITGGYSTDWVRSLQASEKLADGQDLTKDDWLSVARFGGKTLAIGGTAALSSAAASAVSPYKDLVTAGSLAYNAARGNTAAVLGAAGIEVPPGVSDVFNTVNQYLPNAPTPPQPGVPAGPAPVPGSAGTTINDPYGTPKGAVNYTVHTGQGGDLMPYAIAGAAAVGLYLLTRRRR